METKKRYRKYQLSQKLRVIEMYNLGYGCTTISRELSIDITQVKLWISKYRLKGDLWLHKHRYTRYSADFKMKLVRLVLENSLSSKAVALSYDVSLSAVARWTASVLSGGYESLAQTKPIGRQTKIMGRPKKMTPQTEIEKLQEELLYLRAENAYLKKLRALVEQRIACESGKQPKPSKN